MNLLRAACYFDRLTCRDAYGSASFRAQMDVYDDATWDGPSSVRRILSTSPDVRISERGALSIGDKTWIVGESHPDYFKGKVIRVKYTLHQADGLASSRSFGEWPDDAPGHAVFAARTYVRSAKEVEISSGLFTVYEVFFAREEKDKLPDPGVISLEGQDFIFHDPYFTEGGFLAARCSFLPEPRAVARYRSRQYDPVADTWTESAKDIPALVLRWQEHYHYLARYAVKYEEGDKQVLLRKTDVTDLVVGDRLTIGGQEFSVVDVREEDGGAVWSAHGRPT